MAKKKKSNRLYHATNVTRITDIKRHGLKPGMDGVTYFADSMENALKFMVYRFDVIDFAVIAVETSKMNPELLGESFDHSEKFFQCKAWQYADIIPSSDFADIQYFTRKKEEEK